MGNWIPTSERLPEPNQRVMIKGNCVKGNQSVKFVRCSDGDYFWDNLVNHVWQSNEATHWMPISTLSTEAAP